MGVAALGLALGKTPAGAKEATTKIKIESKDEKAVLKKMSTAEQKLFFKLDASERSTFIKYQDRSEAERSNYLKVNAAD